MKKTIFWSLTIALCTVLVACSAPAQAQDLKSNEPRDTAPQVSPGDLQTLVADNNAFAWDLYHQIDSGDGNVLFSPYSLSLALAMAYAGASGGTQQEMASALHFNLPEDQLNAAFDSLALELAKESTVPGSNGSTFTLNVVNDIWAQQGYPFLSSYLETLAVSYGAGLKIVDFQKAAESARQIINQYISDQTQGKITQLLPPGAVNSLTRLVLTNAIYFNAAWQNQFQTAGTQSGSFDLADGNQVSVPMMNNSAFYQYISGSNYQAIELPYPGGQMSMVIVMPALDQFNGFESSFDDQEVQNIISSLSSASVNLTMPKFSFSSNFSLEKQLAALGMPTAFTNEANFSGIDGK